MSHIWDCNFGKRKLEQNFDLAHKGCSSHWSVIAFTFDNQHKHKYMYLYFATSVCAGTRSHANIHKLPRSILFRSKCDGGHFIQKTLCSKGTICDPDCASLSAQLFRGKKLTLLSKWHLLTSNILHLRAYYSNLVPEHSMIKRYLYLDSQ